MHKYPGACFKYSECQFSKIICHLVTLSLLSLKKIRQRFYSLAVVSSLPPVVRFETVPFDHSGISPKSKY